MIIVCRFNTGFSRDAQVLCLQATVAMATMLEQSRMWRLVGLRTGHEDVKPEKEMMEAIKELSAHVVKITEVILFGHICCNIFLLIRKRHDKVS